MIFVFGGAHQGMREYARDALGARNFCELTENDRDIDFSRGAVCNLELFVLGCVQRGDSAVEYFRAHCDAWQDCILIGMDFSCGLVPMDAQDRLWREENGRLNNYIASNAKRVVRLFCGLPQELK